MQGRRHRIRIRDLRRAYALIQADSAAQTAVVFVHGFLGNPLKTWQSFQTLADAHNDVYPWWSGSDLYFFDYPDFNQALDFSGRDLLAFIGRVFPNPEPSLFEADLSAWAPLLHLNDPIVRIRENFSGYTRLILAGHSEGGVVIRKAMIEVASRCIRVNEEIRTMAASAQASSRGWFYLKKEGREFFAVPYSGIPVDLTPVLDISNYPALQAQLCLFAPALMGA